MSTASDLAPLLKAHQSWQTLNLTERRPQFESTAQSLAASKDTSLKARKQLGELTKSLKRAVKTAETEVTPENVKILAGEFKTTIKSYQEEIDSLTRRCKTAESTFLSFYQAIYECEDPSWIIGECLRVMEGKDSQIDNLLRGMEELNGEMEGMVDERKKCAELEKQLEAKDEEIEKLKLEGGGGGGSGDGESLTLAEREELIRLRSEVAEYEVEFRGLKNQDITIRKLESKIAELEENRDEEIQKELKKAQEELAESEGRRAAEALEREAQTARRLESVELQLRAERAGREASATRLLEAEDGLGEREAAWEAQRQILVGDAERLREELAEVGRERDALRLKHDALVKSAEDGEGAEAPTSAGLKLAEYMSERKAYEAEISELSITCNALRDELKVKESNAIEERSSLQSVIDELERDRANLTNRVSSLEMQVANAPSQDAVDKMRHELRILKRLEYNADDFDHDPDHPEMTPGSAKEDDLESVLVAKLRKVEAELVRERREKGDATKERDEIQRKLADLQQSYEEAEELIVSLENDLQVAVATPSTTPSLSRAGSEVPYGSTNPPDPNTLQTILDPKAPPLSGPATLRTSTSTASEKVNDDHSVATIVMAQRDRLRARCDALEAERDSFKRELQVQVQTSESLKTDNTKLYEKVRYLQSFKGGSGNGGSGYMRSKSGLSSDRDLDLEALEQRYEASVDPFRQFSRAERQRKFNEMSPIERIIFIVAKTFLGSKEMRMALFFYIVAMHLLVFSTTYHWSHNSSCDELHNHIDLAHFHGGVPLPETPNGVAAANAAAKAVANASGSDDKPLSF
mmetsp:Transcript_22597/g.45761  ORF Transcript_22597/g.45761 Transcript_22597/m.45761 type:complete len:813 (-) Transcript_22597:52-2490(-)